MEGCRGRKGGGEGGLEMEEKDKGEGGDRGG